MKKHPTHHHPVLTPPEMERRTRLDSEQDRLALFLRTALLNREVVDCSLSDAISRIFSLQECIDPDERAGVERFISGCFESEHGAHITHFMPRLFRLVTRRGELAAAFGTRCAGSERLFLENYLDQPIELELAMRLGYVPARNKIVEVGNLAAALPGAVRWLIVALTVRLYQEGYEWVVFTGTQELRNGFHRLGLRPITLHIADVNRLDETERDQWGSYYANNPLVMAGNIGYGYDEMKSFVRFPKPGEVCSEMEER